MSYVMPAENGWGDGLVISNQFGHENSDRCLRAIALTWVALVMRMYEKMDMLLKKYKLDQSEIMEKLHQISNM